MVFLLRIIDKKIYMDSRNLLTVGLRITLLHCRLDRCYIRIDATDLTSQYWHKDEKKVF